MFVIVHEDLCDQSLVAWLETEKMDVRRAVGMTPLGTQHVSDWSIGRDRVSCGLDRAEAEPTLRVGGELAAQVHVGLAVVLIFVQTDRRRLPDVDLDATDWRAVRFCHPAADEHFRARRR